MRQTNGKEGFRANMALFGSSRHGAAGTGVCPQLVSAVLTRRPDCWPLSVTAPRC